MNFFFRVFKFIYGLILFIRYRRVINLQQLLKGKRVAIVGAADSAFNTGKGSYIDSFDIVIRINKAPLLLSKGQYKSDIGTKTDMLFHSFFENEQSGGGPLDFVLYDALGIRYVINPISVYAGHRVTFNFYKKYLLKRIVYFLPRATYARIQSKLNSVKPTIGFCALYSVIETDFSQLYITGFTFFKTSFGSGYRDDMKEANQVQQFIKHAGIHNPDLEFRIFIELLHNSASKNILMDDPLKQIVMKDKFNN